MKTNNYKLGKKEYWKQYREKNKDRIKAYHKNNKDKLDKANLKRNYGISLEKIEEMRIQQNNSCAICGKIKKLNVDHDHNTGKIRELLCQRCNSLLGWTKENPEKLLNFKKEKIEILLNAIEYLKKHNRNFDDVYIVTREISIKSLINIII